jgi:hypothetical protein
MNCLCCTCPQAVASGVLSAAATTQVWQNSAMYRQCVYVCVYIYTYIRVYSDNSNHRSLAIHMKNNNTRHTLRK